MFVTLWLYDPQRCLAARDQVHAALSRGRKKTRILLYGSLVASYNGYGRDDNDEGSNPCQVSNLNRIANRLLAIALSVVFDFKRRFERKQSIMGVYESVLGVLFEFSNP